MSNRILISWIAYNHDFFMEGSEKNDVNPMGTHGELYSNQDLFNYDCHLLLCASNEQERDIRCICLHSFLSRNFDNNTIPIYLGIDDVINVKTIKDAIRPILMDYRKDAIEAFISPGTAAMQTAWYLLAMEFKNLKLFQIRPPSHRKDDGVIKIFIDVEILGITSGLEILEKGKRNTLYDSNVFITNTIKEQYDKAFQVASTNDVTAIILGSTGTGKEFLAKHIHRNSKRANKPFIAINCAALGDDLLESRLFGHVKGAFTGAIDVNKGAFLEADGGTIFLDEIGDISPKAQQTLLRVLQERAVTPVGTFKTTNVNVRVIAATHKDLLKMVNTGTFRMDLFYRLMVANIETIPFNALPNNERLEFIDFFLEQKRILFERKSKLKISEKAKNCLLTYPFPGNFRELENTVEYCYVICQEQITKQDIPYRIRFPETSMTSLKIKDLENKHILKVLGMFSGNRERTRKALGISAGKLSQKIKELGWNNSLN